jgi:hypothetical protein
VWSLDEGLRLLRGLQQPIREYNYHLAIGGGVVNKGHSEKDLDLYFLPMNSTGIKQPDALLKFLTRVWGPPESLKNEDYPDSEFNKAYIHAVKFFRYNKGREYPPQRIDCFIF